jgi:hypothetical protein
MLDPGGIGQQTVVADAVEALYALQCIKGFMRSTGLCGECRWRAAAIFVISTDCGARTVESLCPSGKAA